MASNISTDPLPGPSKNETTNMEVVAAVQPNFKDQNDENYSNKGTGLKNAPVRHGKNSNSFNSHKNKQYFRNSRDYYRSNYYDSAQNYSNSNNYHTYTDQYHSKNLNKSKRNESKLPNTTGELDSSSIEDESVVGFVVNGKYVKKEQLSDSNKQGCSSSRNFESDSYKDNNNFMKQNLKPWYERRQYQNNFKTQNKTYSNQRYQDKFSRQPNRNNYEHRNTFRKKNTYEKYSSENSEKINVNISSEKSASNFIDGEDEFKKKDTITQRDSLIHQLEKGECECMVCCELIRTRDQIWNCTSCYHVFHLRCIKKWARSPSAIVLGCGWRCPACQNISKNVPYHYYCFCGKCKEPEVNQHLIPHSCGDICGKKRDDKNCVHHCNLLCHPGPCPPCSATVSRSCACGQMKKTVPCNQSSPITCHSVCGRLLNCECHTCPELCHVGDCKPCSFTIKQKCYCCKNEREILCEASTAGVREYSCDEICDRMLDCNFHKCIAKCHSGPCQSCVLLPNVVIACPCGKTLLEDLYTSGKANKRLYCTDPIPLCEFKCEKILKCGSKDNPHKCDNLCHNGFCPPCQLSTSVKCQCGFTSKDVPCVELSSLLELKCEKRCTRRKDCGRHKCLNTCCVNNEHKCELVCNKKLSCGNHTCQERCHAGKCPTCWNVSFDELRCHCGQAVLFPPIHCGTKPPECDKPCIRTHPCGHEARHTCHSDPQCPPCTAFTTKWCFGNHERHSHIPCFLDGISCGKLCNKLLPCKRHKCREICHIEPCLKNDGLCSQPCETLRSCGHPCATPCHDGDCPDTPCKAMITVTCSCGNRTETATCSEDSNTYRLMSVSLLATKMHDLKAGESVNISDLLGKKPKNNRLQCNEECAVLERNKRLAVALQIQNPELSCKPGPPLYSELLKEETKKNPKFVSNVYDKFTELVQLAKQSKQKSRSFAFPPMNRDHRRIIHEMAQFFGCETQSYDEEPMKNVVIIASRDKSWLPFVSIMAVVQREKEREMGLRKGPSPCISENTSKPQSSTAVEKKEKIDYFDFPG